MGVYVRPLHKSDAAISFHWRNDPEIWRYTGSRPDKKVTYDDELKWIQNTLSETDSLRFAICLTDSDRYVGNIQLTSIEAEQAEFHIFIGDRSFWGKGVGSEATKLFLDHVKSNLSLKLIYLSVHSDNIAAVRIYEKLGFILVGDRMELSLDTKG